MSACSHPDTEPVYAYLHRQPPQVGDAVIVANDGRPVAHVCRTCLARLPGSWGCGDCEWVETRRLCDEVPELVLGRPCPAHEGGDR